MLGTDLARRCREKQIDFHIFDLPEFDITDESMLKDVTDKFSTIVNCAAYTNVDGAQTEQEAAYQINAEAVEMLGNFSKSKNCYVIHISTDFVFDGQLSQPYKETDTPNPISVYGASKYEGEQRLGQTGCDHAIIRVQWTYGQAGNNFAKKIIAAAQGKNELKVVDDQIGSPTHTYEAAKAICDFIEKKPMALFHFAADGYASRLEMARFIFEKKQIAITLSGCKTSDFTSPAARPLNSRFDCSKIKPLLSEPIRPWQAPLEEFLRQT